MILLRRAASHLGPRWYIRLSWRSAPFTNRPACAYRLYASRTVQEGLHGFRQLDEKLRPASRERSCEAHQAQPGQADVFGLIRAELGSFHTELSRCRRATFSRAARHRERPFLYADARARSAPVFLFGRTPTSRSAYVPARCRVYEAALRQQDHPLAVGEFDLATCRLDVVPLRFFRCRPGSRCLKWPMLRQWRYVHRAAILSMV